ncbi:hypothetical protein WJX79_009485 [Trebouxia sp. C0005]
MSPAVDSGAIIVSELGTSVPWHVEDNCRGSFNHLLFGAAKIWYLAPPDFGAQLTAKLGTQTPAQLFTKTLFAKLSGAELREMGVRRVLQQPGYMMLTCAGYTWHATCSIGFSIAEASNFFNHGMGLTVRETTEMYSEVHKMAEQACQQHPQLSEDVQVAKGVNSSG